MRVVSPLLALTWGAILFPLAAGQSKCPCPDGQSSYDAPDDECTLELDMENCPDLTECPETFPATGMCRGLEGQECGFGRDCCTSGPGQECVCHPSIVEVCEADETPVGPAFRAMIITDACFVAGSMGGQYCGNTCDGCPQTDEDGEPPIDEPDDLPCYEEFEATNACGDSNGCDFDASGCYVRRRLQDIDDTITIDNMQSYCLELSQDFCCGLSFCPACADEIATELKCYVDSDELTCDVEPWATPDSCDDIPKPPTEESPCADESEALDACGTRNNCEFLVIWHDISLYLQEDTEGEDFCSGLQEDFLSESSRCPSCASELAAEANCIASSWSLDCIMEEGASQSTEPPPSEEPCAEEYETLEACEDSNQCVLSMSECFVRRRLQDDVDMPMPDLCSVLSHSFCCELPICPACVDELTAASACDADAYELTCDVSPWVTPDACDDITQPATDSTEPTASAPQPTITQTSTTTETPPTEEPCAEEYEATDACVTSNECDLEGSGCYVRRRLQNIDDEPPLCSVLTYGFCCLISICPSCADELAAEATCEVDSDESLDCNFDAPDETICRDYERMVDDSSGSGLKVHLAYLWTIGVLAVI